jgi:hypothetical protein
VPSEPVSRFPMPPGVCAPKEEVGVEERGQVLEEKGNPIQGFHPVQ